MYFLKYIIKKSTQHMTINISTPKYLNEYLKQHKEIQFKIINFQQQLKVQLNKKIKEKQLEIKKLQTQYQDEKTKYQMLSQQVKQQYNGNLNGYQVLNQYLKLYQPQLQYNQLLQQIGQSKEGIILLEQKIKKVEQNIVKLRMDKIQSKKTRESLKKQLRHQKNKQIRNLNQLEFLGSNFKFMGKTKKSKLQTQKNQIMNIRKSSFNYLHDSLNSHVSNGKLTNQKFSCSLKKLSQQKGRKNLNNQKQQKTLRKRSFSEHFQRKAQQYRAKKSHQLIETIKTLKQTILQKDFNGPKSKNQYFYPQKCNKIPQKYICQFKQQKSNLKLRIQNSCSNENDIKNNLPLLATSKTLQSFDQQQKCKQMFRRLSLENLIKLICCLSKQSFDSFLHKLFKDIQMNEFQGLKDNKLKQNQIDMFKQNISHFRTHDFRKKDKKLKL